MLAAFQGATVQLPPVVGATVLVLVTVGRTGVFVLVTVGGTGVFVIAAVVFVAVSAATVLVLISVGGIKVLVGTFVATLVGVAVFDGTGVPT